MRALALRRALFASALTGLVVTAGAAQDAPAEVAAEPVSQAQHQEARQEIRQGPRLEMRLPQISSAKIDWASALASLSDVEELRFAALTTPPRQARNASRPVPRCVAPSAIDTVT